jgi:hypothetical protein
MRSSDSLKVHLCPLYVLVRAKDKTTPQSMGYLYGLVLAIFFPPIVVVVSFHVASSSSTIILSLWIYVCILDGVQDTEPLFREK